MDKKKKIGIIVLAILFVLIIIGELIMNGNTNNADTNNDMSQTIQKNIANKNEEIEIKESETKSVQYTNYNNGLISVDIPEGWKVDVIGDCIHYTIKVYNPQDPDYQFFFNMKTEGYNKSQEAKNFQQTYYPDSMFAKTSVIEGKNTEGFYKIFNDLGTLNNTAAFTFPTLTDFTVVENMGTSPLGGDILRATFKDANGKEGEGVFSAYVYDAGPYYVKENVFSGKEIDIYYLNVYNATFITAPKDKFLDWESVLSKISSSLQFTDSFMSQYNSQQDAVMQNFQNVRSICNQITDGIMSSWEARNKSYDIMSQKQSDAILGYERVYDTETGEIYKAYNGFTDDYYGERYKSITEDMYTKSTDGYIEKK